ncbi:MAG: cupredoxin domain-containing protein [Bacillaceae bacterium]|nr:cupredoxin domain-containing protein [Bacillaceae bacterium]
MHLHKYERIWLMFGGASLVVFLAVIGITAFFMGDQPPSGAFCAPVFANADTVDPEKVTETPPFNEPGIKKVGENQYVVTMVAYSFGFQPSNIEIPAGAEVYFQVTSKDVVHGFEIPGTNVNMMITPGYVNTIRYTFDEPGNYLILCNEYCGVGHQFMSTTVEVK